MSRRTCYACPARTDIGESYCPTHAAMRPVPCPLCGKTPDIHCDQWNGWHVEHCGHRTPRTSYEGAINAWAEVRP